MVWAMPPDEFGAWGQWAGAIFAAVAVAVALWVAISDTRRRDREEKERDREREDGRAAQARTVTATVATVSDQPGVPAERASRHRFAIVVENHGVLPVARVVVTRIAAKFDGNDLHNWKIAGLSENAHESGAVWLCDILGPGDSFHSPALTFQHGNATFSKVEQRTARVEIGFVDAEGNAWVRAGNGRPRYWANAFDEMT